MAGEIARAFVRTLLPFLIGLGGGFVLLLGAGMLAEEGRLDDPRLTMALDHLSRFSVIVLAVLAACAWGGYAVTTFLREVTTSRAILRAAQAGADKHQVPSPEQVEAITRQPGAQLTYFAWGTGGVAVLAALIGIGVVFTEGDKAGPMLVTFLSLGWVAGTLWFVLDGTKRLTAVHERRQAEIAAHWRSDDEAKAWRRAQQRKNRQMVGHMFRPADRLMYLATFIGGIAMLLLQVSLGMRCSAVPGSPGQRCEETYYSSPVESALSWGFGLSAMVTVLAIVLLAGGLLLDWRQRHAEADDLRKRLDDPTSSRPDDVILAHHARRHTPLIARMAAVLSALGMLFGISAYFVGRGKGLGSEEVYAAYQTEELVVVAVSTALLVIALIGTAAANIHGREFRNQLMRRWPAAPSWFSGEEGKVLRAKTGPALGGPRYKKVGKNKSSHS